MLTKACVIYARVSTVEQAAPGHHSLDAQEALCRKYAESEGYKVVEVIRDEGYTGRTTQRPGMKRLMEYTGNRPPTAVAAILAQDTSRVGRDTTEYLLFRRELRERGIKLVAVTQPNIDASPEGQLVDTILAGINQYQSEEKGRRVSIAMQKKFDDGWFPGWAPLGYSNVTHDGRRTIAPDPERFELVRLAFAEYATGRYTQGTLLRFLSEKGLRDLRGKPLSRTSLNQLLANPFYWGLMRWNGRERIGRHEPVTERSIWERCQAVTAEHNHYSLRERKHRFLLAGLTLCASCGHRHTHSVVPRKKKRYYHCQSHRHCPEPYIPEDALERQVTHIVSEIRLSDEFITRVVEQVRAVFTRRNTLQDTRKSTLLRRRTLAEQKRDLAEQKLVAGVLSDDAFRRLMPQIARELDEIHRELETLEASRRVSTDTLEEVLRFARDIPAAYAQAPPLLQRRYLEFFFRAFVVKDRKVIETVPTEFFQTLLEGAKVRNRPNWYPRLNVNRTKIQALIHLFANQEWLGKLRELMRETGRLAA